MNDQSNPGWVAGYVPSSSEWAAVFSGKQDANAPVLSTAASLTLAATGDYAYDGSIAAAWTLPPIATGATPFDLVNMSAAGTVTLHADSGDGANRFWNAGTTSSTFAIGPGTAYRVVNYGTLWVVTAN